MKFRRPKLLLKIAIFIVIVLLIKLTFTLVCKYKCYSKKTKPVATFKEKQNDEPTPTTFQRSTERIMIDETNSWATYQRDIILKNKKDRQHFEENANEDDTSEFTTNSMATQKSHFQTAEGFTTDKKEENNEFDSRVLEGEETDIPGNNENEISSEIFRLTTAEQQFQTTGVHTKHETADNLFDEYERVNQFFENELQRKEKQAKQEEIDEEKDNENQDVKEEELEENTKKEDVETDQESEDVKINENENEEKVTQNEGKDVEKDKENEEIEEANVEKDEEKATQNDEVTNEQEEEESIEERENIQGINEKLKHEKETSRIEAKEKENPQQNSTFTTPAFPTATKSKTNTLTQKTQHNATQKNKFPVKKKLVLLYTTLFDRMPWPDLENSDNFTQFRGQPCAVRNCEITYNKSRIVESDAVIFHGRDLPSAEKMRKMPRREKQRWVFFMHENPVFTYKNLTHYNHLFNWTMTYRWDSEFFVPYNYYSRLESDENSRLRPKSHESFRVKSEQLTTKNYAKGKDKLVAWMVGNCGQLRDKIVSKLTNYINVTIFGACARKFNQSSSTCSRGSRDCNKRLQRFKFYLAFENQMCLDYVTEKYWYTPLEHDMVPVVLGSNYNDKISIPGSFINVLDFPSIRSLAEYLQYLDRNDTAFNEYFKWKTKYKLDYPLSVVWTCNLCAALNNASIPNKVYHDLDMFWGAESTCGRNSEKINALLEDSHDGYIV